MSSLGIALLAAVVFNHSVALGAFLGVPVVGQSRFGPQAAQFPFRGPAAAAVASAAARALNPRIAIVATAAGDAERAWLQEFGATFTCDPLDEASDALLSAIHAGL